ncbi:ArsR/SmtB family transcription factor [Sulfobacillus harzensis]|uniref:Winged helix-turn-helix transcriptional regulator n=1 Tax=Sulfobacillus harzensis TaxID=2729629 RepID=A0A7Y0L1L8_9FIRM|nr:metalloregulator ArsR/SmtB family transcription factor [Sulfobacillus harzensis]NMP21550.1 winged helix-turn-helix transcriptional regulator [Sulfobacillus harzensis]
MPAPLSDDLGTVFKALADPLRRRILRLLSDAQYHCRNGDKTVNGICVQDLSKYLEAPQSTISRHLAILSGADLVFHDRDRTWHYYAVNASRVGAVVDWMRTLIPVGEGTREATNRLHSPRENFGGESPQSLATESADSSG